MLEIDISTTEPYVQTLSADKIKVIDADCHYTEPHDLWTSRVPAKYKELMPHVVRRDGRDMWLFNGDEVLNPTNAVSASIMKDNKKYNFWETDIMDGPQIEEVHESAWDVKSRLKMMDEMGVWAQVCYPNVLGFAAGRLIDCPDKALTSQIVSVYNDAMLELQSESGDRLFPQALVPFWDIDAATSEIERVCGTNKLRGITMAPEPQAGGMPDLLHTHWDPLWELCSELNVPINFHIGASAGTSPFDLVWPSQDRYRRWVIAMALLESGQARILANLVTGDLLERFPKTKWVSVESGIGWIPFILERMEYQLYECEPADSDMTDYARPRPTELFKRQVYACFWFEQSAPDRLLDVIGVDNVLFESDFPHPTCLYPSPVERVLKTLQRWGPEVQRKVMGGNAAKLYNIPL